MQGQFLVKKHAGSITTISLVMHDVRFFLEFYTESLIVLSFTKDLIQPTDVATKTPSFESH